MAPAGGGGSSLGFDSLGVPNAAPTPSCRLGRCVAPPELGGLGAP
eukprot:SAG11_NODE_11362_length_766_cov_0.695652_1_plen_44_part_01